MPRPEPVDEIAIPEERVVQPIEFVHEPEPDEDFKANHQADMEWAQYRSRRGLTPESMSLQLQEFIRHMRMSRQLLNWMRARGK